MKTETLPPPPFQDLQHYQTEPVELKVQGEIPAWLKGVLYRVGPGKNVLLSPNGDKVKLPHWFDGIGTGHRFSVREGRVTYSNCCLAPRYEEEMSKPGQANNTILVSAVDPCQSVFRRFINIFRPLLKDVDNIAVTVTPGFPALPRADGTLREGLVVKSDANMLLEVDPQTFLPQRVFTYTEINPELKGLISASHEQIDNRTGEYFNFVTELGTRPIVKFFSLSPTSRSGRVLAEIRTAATYVHSFGMTENYLIFVQCPLMYEKGGLGIVMRRGLLQALEFDAERGTKVFLIDRRNGRGVVKTYELPSFFFFHQVCSWEEVDENSESRDIFMRLSTYPNDDVFRKFYLHGVNSGKVPIDAVSAMPKLQLIRLKDVTGIRESPPRATIVDDRFPIRLEMPCSNAANLGYKPLQCVYGLTYEGQPEMWLNQIVKIDYAKETVLYWSEPHCYPNEPTFVADPDTSNEEDAGLLLSVVLNQKTDESFLLILDAKTMTELGRAVYDGRIPISLHGAFVSIEARKP